MSKFASQLIEKSVKYALELIPIGSPKIILGVSGGPDSMALLYAFYSLQIDVLGIHINYGLRGNESNLDQELVEGMCFEWGFECCSVRLDSNLTTNNFQNWARDERYRIFKEIRDLQNNAVIATAHHKDDQIETVFQKLLRGSGVEAWKGMSIWDGTVLRPLLPLSKVEITAYCEEQSIPFRIDKSNLESKYARNFLRNEVFDTFDNLFPGWRSNILTLTEKGKVASQAVNHILNSISDDYGINLSKFSELEIELKISILKRYLEISVKDFAPSKAQLLQLIEIEYVQVGTQFPISDHHALFRDRQYIAIKSRDELEGFSLIVNKTKLKEGVQLTSNSISISVDVNATGDLYFDCNKIEWPITIRQWKNGDKFIPFGMIGAQKVSDHLRNRKITSINKEKALILSGADGTIYAIIFPEKALNGEIGSISEKVKCTESTTEYININEN